jgi:hypothetical protein
MTYHQEISRFSRGADLPGVCVVGVVCDVVVVVVVAVISSGQQ